MSELLALCDALSHVILPLPANAHYLRTQAHRMRALADEVQYAANDVPAWMDCSSVVLGLYEAADMLEESCRALRDTFLQGRSYVRRTVSVNASADIQLSPKAAPVATDHGIGRSEDKNDAEIESIDPVQIYPSHPTSSHDIAKSTTVPFALYSQAASSDDHSSGAKAADVQNISEHELVALINSQGSELVRDNHSPLGQYLRFYKATGHIQINGLLRQNFSIEDVQNQVRQAVYGIDQAFGEYRLEQDATLYRGISDIGLPFDIYSIDLGESLPDGAFVSVSAKESKGREFAKPILEVIHAPAGIVYLPLSYPGDGLDEAELLLPRGTTLLTIPSNIRDAPPDMDATIRFDLVPLPPGISSPNPREDPLEYARIAWQMFEHETERSHNEGATYA